MTATFGPQIERAEISPRRREVLYAWGFGFFFANFAASRFIFMESGKEDGYPRSLAPPEATPRREALRRRARV